MSDENFTEKTREQELEETFESSFEAFTDDLLMVHMRVTRICSTLELIRKRFPKPSRATVLAILGDAEGKAKSFDEKFPDGFAAEISGLAKQFDEWQAEKNADPAEPTGGHVGDKDFL